MERHEPVETIKFSRNSYVRVVSQTVLVTVVTAVLLLLMLSSGTFLAGWFGIVAFFVMTLALISSPRDLNIYDDKVVIRGMVENTVIHYDQIASLRYIGDMRITDYIPLYSSLGFLGYFGYYYDRTERHMTHLICTSLTDCFEINTFSGRHYILSIAAYEQLSEMLDKNGRAA